jgi:hypothetical protein
MFISIKKYLDSRPEQVASALLRMVQLLLQGLELHAVACRSAWTPCGLRPSGREKSQPARSRT